MKMWHGAAALSVLLLAGCKIEQPRNDTRDEQARLSREAAQQVRFNSNAERENIRRRLELTSDPNLLGYIVLFNEAGQPILYEGVRGKVTSGGKRLTEPARLMQAGNGNGGYNMTVMPAPSDEGTWGSGSDYIYYWSTDGVYRQWSGHYLYSTQPIRLRVEPVVVNIVPEAGR